MYDYTHCVVGTVYLLEMESGFFIFFYILTGIDWAVSLHEMWKHLLNACMHTCSSEMDTYVHTVSSRSVILCSFSCLSLCSLLSTTANLYCVSSSIIRSSWISFSFSQRASELVLSYEQGQNSNWQLVKTASTCWTHTETLRFVHLFVWKLQIPTTKHDRYHEMEGNATSIPVL